MNQPRLKLVSFTMCSYVQRAIIAMREKNIEYELEYIDLSMPPDWFFDVSPLEKVPVLLVDGQPLFESMAICEYINDISGGNLYPDDALLRAQQRAWIELGSSVLGTVYDVIQTADQTEFKRARATVIDRLDVVEDELAADPFFAGQRFGMVDLAYAPLFQFLNGIARNSGIDFYEDAPGIKTWSEQVLAHPSVAASVPDDYETLLRDYLRRPDTVLSGLIK